MLCEIDLRVVDSASSPGEVWETAVETDSEVEEAAKEVKVGEIARVRGAVRPEETEESGQAGEPLKVGAAEMACAEGVEESGCVVYPQQLTQSTEEKSHRSCCAPWSIPSHSNSGSDSTASFSEGSRSSPYQTPSA
jgi:hypothetical protein